MAKFKLKRQIGSPRLYPFLIWQPLIDKSDFVGPLGSR